ncbi:MAG TPA: glycerol-3-phosphate 1-O-acyltransferase PlsY [Candidatus Acidoferrales bacterium]|nr:glycerol-3-phosphate 1-O-acyltransferase PlsY [Candidatus Acidoferrales bacterium]
MNSPTSLVPELMPLIIPIAYLLGSIPFGLLIVKLTRGTDVRQAGSGNIGAANVTRTAGYLAGVLTLILDAAKGFAAVWIAMHWSHGNMRWMIAAAVAAIVGHVFPFGLAFRGGKGVATGLGVFLLICWQAVAAAVVLWIVIVAFWRYSSLGSVVATAALPVFVYVLYAPGHAPPDFVTFPTVCISVLVLLKHRANIHRLIAGEENRIGKRK